MKFQKIYFLAIIFIFLSGCIQSTALLGPGVTLATTGNIMQAGLQYGANTAIKNETGKKVNDETMRLLEIQKNSMIKFLMKIPKLYYTKSHFPLEISQRAFDHLWRICESYEMWCNETKQEKLIVLDILS